MLQFFFRIRYMTILAVLGALTGAFLLFIIGGYHVFEAFGAFLGLHGEASNSQSAVVWVIESLDNFLLGFVLLYFAYSTYFLFLAKQSEDEEAHKIDMPKWLKVEDLGHMKRVLLEVILVLLSVFLLKLVVAEDTQLDWTVIILPISIIAVAISLKLVTFD